ncbi:MAG: polysaccharide biosynthesis tyrosine autokinase [Bacteroidetes bacterium]|nr:polysaccharide biosynthesis tyrosine autokinase [Bacteroidota bacterium]
MVRHKTETKAVDDDIDLSGVIKEIQEQKWWFAISLVLCLILAVGYIKLKQPVYEASSTVLIQETGKPAVNMEDFLAGDIFGDQANIATEKGILGSRSVMSATIQQLHLDISYINNSIFPPKPAYKKQPFLVQPDSTLPLASWLYDVPFNLTFIDENKFTLAIEAEDEKGNDFVYLKNHEFGEKIVTDKFSFVIQKNPSGQFNVEFKDFEFIVHATTGQINDYLSRLRIESPDKDATIVKLTFQDEIPERGVDVLNTLCKVYINLDIQDKTTVASLTLKFVDEQLNETSEVVSSIESELQGFKEKNETVNLSEESRSYLDKLNAIDVEKMKSDIELSSLDNLYKYVTSNAEMTELAPSTLGIPDPLLIELISKFQELQAKRKSLSYGVKSATPAVKVIDQQIAELRASLIENIKSIQQNVNTTNKALSSQLNQYESKIRQIPEIERDLLSIQRKFEVNQNIYIYLLQKKAETSIAKAAAISDNKILDSASLIDEPVEPNKKMVLLLALFASIAIPLILLFTIKFLKTTVSNREELTRLTKVPVLGIVGHVNLNDNLIVHHNPKSRISEAFRSIRTNLQFFGSTSGNKIILVTSSVGGEGKSFVTINLASVIAMLNYKVVIVGLDLRKPKLFEDFKLGNETGVSSYLIGKSSIEALIKPTGIPHLDIISAGPIPPNPSELISKPQMGAFFEELSKMYDYIVVDTPPVGIVSDALLLMNYSHINIYVVRENYSRKEYIASLNEQFEEGKFKNISILLNDSNFGNSYGYGYGYGNGSGYYDDDFTSNGMSKKILKRIPQQLNWTFYVVELSPSNNTSIFEPREPFIRSW